MPTNEAVTIFERLYALPSASVAIKAEASYNCAKALDDAGRKSEANEIRWLTSIQLLSQNPTPVAKYWISKNLFNLAEKLSKDGKKRDAQATYEMIVKHKLPSYTTAENRLKTIRK